MPRDLGVVSITCASGSRWADFSMGCRISALAPTTLAMVRKKPAECWPRQIPIQDRRCRSLALLGTHSIMPLKKKKCLVTVETVRGIFPVPFPFPLLHQSNTPWKWIIQKWKPLQQGKRRAVSEYPTTPVVQGTSGETHFFPAAPRVQRQDPQNWEREESRKETDKNNQGALRVHSCWWLCSGLQQEVGPQTAGNTSSDDTPTGSIGIPTP